MQEDIRRTVLFLINGFGVDKRDIYDILNDNTVPYINKLARENIYTTMPSIATDYKTGFRMFSIGQKDLPGYKKLGEDMLSKFEKNERFNNIANEVLSRNKKLHIFCYLDNETTIDQAKKIIQCLNDKGIKNIYIHVILRTLKDFTYKKLEKNINSLKLVIFNNPNVNFGVFLGSDMIDKNLNETKELYQMLITEVGERWPDFVRKIDILESKKTKPSEIRPFFITGGFKVEEGDSILFLNYEYVDYTNIVDLFQNPKLYFSLSHLPGDIHVYSLFPLKSKVNITSIYENEESENHLVKYMEKIQSKALVITTQDRIPYINNFCNGLQNVKSDRLDFMLLDDNLPIANVVTNPNYQFYIFDLDISNVNNINELRNALIKADTKLGKVAYQCKLYDYSLFISSLYGISREWKRENNQVYHIDYSNEMPLIIVDRLIIKGKHYVNQGTIINLLPTLINNMKPTNGIPSMISTPSGGILSSLFKR